MTEPDLLTLDETAKLLRVSTRTLYREAGRKELRIIKIRGSSMIERAELERYLRSRRVA